MNIDVTLGGRTTSWRFRDSGVFEAWVSMCPWREAGGVRVIRTGTRDDVERLIPAIRRCIRSIEPEIADRQIVRLSVETLDEGLVPKLSDHLGLASGKRYEQLDHIIRCCRQSQIRIIIADSLPNGRQAAILSDASTIVERAFKNSDPTVLWPDWLRVADRLSDLLKLWYPSRWQIEKVVNRFGYTMKRVGEFAWSICPDADANTTVILSAKVAAADIRDAGVAFTKKDYTAAAQHCIKALDRCPMAHAAHLLIAELSRQRHCRIDMEHQLQSAVALLDRQRNVQHTLDRMKTLRKTARSNGHRECVTESIEQLENEIAAITPQCVWAQQTLEENMEADNDGE